MTNEIVVEMALKFLIALAGIVLTILGWSLRQNLMTLTEAITKLTKEVHDVAQRVGLHSEELAGNRATVNGLVARVAQIETQVTRVLTDGCARACDRDER